MQLDHIFVFVDSLNAGEQIGAALGLTETYRRRHPGQGTSNICYCFDNAFLELLVLESAEDAASAPIARTRLLERSRWRDLETCPLGIAWRLDHDEAPLPFPLWNFRPPYLPPTAAIPVAIESDDPKGPMLFQSPGTLLPSEWPPERRGELQQPGGLSRIAGVKICYPISYKAGPVFQEVARQISVALLKNSTETWSLTLDIDRSDGTRVELGII